MGPEALYIHTYIHFTCIQTLDNTHTQGLNLTRGRSLGDKRTVDINEEQTDGLLDEI